MKTGKTGTKSLLLRSVFVLAVMLVFVFAAPSSVSAAGGKNDEHLISLPDKKNDGKTKPAATQKAPVREENMLQGVFYDLKLKQDGQINNDFIPVTRNGEYFSSNFDRTIKVVQPFVNGSWQRHYDAKGLVSYSDLNAYYCPATRVWTSSFYIGDTASSTAPQVFDCPKVVQPNCWVCIYSGYVVAPFSGFFRFVGFGDDFLVVRFNQEIVFDYGRISATLGAALGPEKRSALSKSASSSAKRTMPTINKGENANSFYSNNKLVIRSPEYMDTTQDFGCGLANGSIINVRKGDVIPIDILIGDVGGGFNYVLFVERLDVGGWRLNYDKPLQLFRTSDVQPPSFTTSSAVAYDPNSPVWKVVDSRGRPIPSHIPSGAKKDDTPDASAGAAQASSSQGSQPRRKEAFAAKADNKTTLRIVVYDGDTTTETVITSQPSGKNLIQTKKVTETKNGEVVRTQSASRTVLKTKAKTADTGVRSELKNLILKTRETQSGKRRSSSPFGVANPQEADESLDLDEMLDDLPGDWLK